MSEPNHARLRATRTRIGTKAPWEPVVGYSRAVRVGPFVAVTGTTALDADGNLVGEGDPGVQARKCIENIASALERVGATLADVVRTRVFVTDITAWEAIGRAHGEAFAGILPATTMVEVSALVDPRMLVEIEADAICTEEP